MRKGIKKALAKTYDDAFTCYVKGKWDEAKIGFEKSIALWPKDNLSEALLKYMESNNNTPPPDWKGYKYFDE